MNNVNLPVLNPLKNDESTYITFSKALTDLDRSISLNTEYYFSKMVAIKLPDWSETDFYINPQINPSDVGLTSINPNSVLPNYFARYTENIIRQQISEPRITELAFWKTIATLHRTPKTIESIIADSVKIINQVVTSDFYELKNNNGWGKIIAQIPNTTEEVIFNSKTLLVPSIHQSVDSDNEGLYDNSSKQFLFNDIKVIDFDSVKYQKRSESTEFNCILLFYRDSDGVDKLHGINFINPFINKATSWLLPTLTLNNNNIGYQFIFNIKTCNNEASVAKILENNEHLSWWNGFETTFDKLNTLLDLKIRESKILKY